MKIKLTSNVKMKNSSLDVLYGFSYLGSKSATESDSFLIKFLSKIHNYFDIANQSLEVSNSVLNTIKYLEKNIHNKSEKLQDIGVQINQDSKFNKYLKFLLKGLGLKEEFILNVFNNNTALACIETKQILIGANLFDNDSFFISNKKVKEVSKSEKVQFVMLHEFSHLIEPVYEEKNYSEKFKNILQLCTNFLNEEKSSENLKNTIFNLLVMKTEMYADVSAMLLINDFNIKNNMSCEKIEEQLDYWIFLRNQNSKQLDHLTNQALLSLKASDIVKDKKLLEENEINKITHEHVEKGFARTLYTLLASESSVKHEIIDFCNEYALRSNNNLENDLRELAGEDWITVFDKKADLVKMLHSNYTSRNEALYQMGLGLEVKMKKSMLSMEEVKDNISSLRKNTCSQNMDTGINKTI